VDDIIESGIDPLPSFVEDLRTVRETVDPVLQHPAGDGRGHVLPEECDPGGPRKILEQVPGLGLGSVSLVQAGFKFDSDCDSHTRQLPNGKRERCVAVSLKGTEFFGNGRSDQALRELTILGLGGKGVEPGTGVVCKPDGGFGGEGNGEVRDVESWAPAKVKNLHAVETIQRPQ